MLNRTYRHLDARIKIAGLTFVQWLQLFGCGLAAYALASVLPLPGSWSLSIAITICGVPAVAAAVAMQGDFDVWGFARSALRWRRRAHLYLPGAPEGTAVAGYVVRPAPGDAPSSAAGGGGPVLVEELWR